MGTGAVRGQQVQDRQEVPVIAQIMTTCESCSVTFTIFKRRKMCSDCGRSFCASCLLRVPNNPQSLRQCKKCKILLSGNFTSQQLMQWKVKDLRLFLDRKNIATHTCTEKHDLVELLLRHYGNIPYVSDIYFDHQVDQPPSQPREAVEREQSIQNPMHFTRPDNAETLQERQQREMQEAESRLQHNLDFQSLPGVAHRPNYMTLESIQSEKDIEWLSVKELKEVLNTNFVDYKDCVEKWELLKKVQQLWQQHTDQEKAGSTTTDDDVCKICMAARIDCVLLECGHMVSCTKCGRRLAECPICRQYVVRAVHIFKA